MLFLFCFSSQANSKQFRGVNNTSFVCLKLATVHEVCHVGYKIMGTIMKVVIFVVCNE